MTNTHRSSGPRLTSSRPYRIQDDVAGDVWLIANTRSSGALIVAGPGDEVPDPLEDAKRSAVELLLAAATAPQREVLQLVVVERMSLAEAAGELGITKQSAHERFTRGLKNVTQAAADGVARPFLEQLGISPTLTSSDPTE